MRAAAASRAARSRARACVCGEMRMRGERRVARSRNGPIGKRAGYEPTRVTGAHQASRAPPSVMSLDETRRATTSKVPPPSRPPSPPRLDQGRGEVPPPVALGLVGLGLVVGNGCGRVLETASGGAWTGRRGWTIDAAGYRVRCPVHRAPAYRVPGPLVRSIPLLLLRQLLRFAQQIRNRLWADLHYPCVRKIKRSQGAREGESPLH